MEDFPQREVFDTLVLAIHKDIEEIQSGSSELVPRAIYFPKGNVLPAIVLDRFIQKPQRRSLENFFAVAEQDLGRRAADHWKSQFNKILEEVGSAPIH